MTKQHSVELLSHLKEQNEQIGALKHALNDCIKKREQKSHLNWLALQYGEAPWWKKFGLFIGYVTLCGTGIYIAGISPFFMLPFLGAYLVSIFFISNHYSANQTLNTKTLEILEGILSESITAINTLKNRFSDLVEACSELNDAQKDEHAAFDTQLQRMKTSNERYSIALGLLEPLVERIASAEKTTQEKSQLLLNLFERTHAIMLEGKNALTQMLSPKVSQTITVLEGTQSQFLALKANFQKNLTTMNTFAEKLEHLMHQLETKPDIMDAQRETTAQKTKMLCEKADRVIARAQRLLAEPIEGRSSNDENTPPHPQRFFGEARNRTLPSRHSSNQITLK